MQRIINESDTFQLILEENIDNEDYQYLFMLYQPIIGIKAINLYLTLIQEKNLTNRINLEFNHKRLMLLLDLNEIELLQAFQILESYQLLNSYYYSLKSTYIYQLQKPLSPKQFFATPKLANNLADKLGNLQFERQKYYFLTSQPEITEDFINISHNDDYQKAEIRTSRINLQELISKLNKSQTAIDNASYHMNDPIKETIKENNIIINQPKTYQLRANLQAATQSLNIPNRNVLTQTLNSIQEKSPEEYLFYLTKKPIDIKFKNALKQLMVNYQLNNEVINCLLEYTWFKNDKRIEPNYILKIGKTFQENKINNANDAINHLKLAYLKGKKNSFTNAKAYHQDVLWTNDQVDFDFNKNKKIAQNENQNVMTEEEIKKILEEFDNH